MTSAPTTPPSATGQVITLRGEQEFLARAGHLLDPRAAVICAATDLSTWAAPGAQAAAATRMRKRGAAGVTVRKMYNPGALADPEDTDHLLTAAAGSTSGSAWRDWPTRRSSSTVGSRFWPGRRWMGCVITAWSSRRRWWPRCGRCS